MTQAVQRQGKEKEKGKTKERKEDAGRTFQKSSSAKPLKDPAANVSAGHTTSAPVAKIHPQGENAAAAFTFVPNRDARSRMGFNSILDRRHLKP